MRRRRPSIPTFLLPAAAVAVLAAGCGGSSAPPVNSANQSSPVASIGKRAVAFAVCMRSHGVPGYPDPLVSSAGTHVQVTISPGGADPNSPAFKSAGHTCHGLLPNGGRPVNGAQDQAQGRVFADCMRSHGVPSFPDADRDGAFTLSSTTNQQAPAFQHAMKACASTQPSSLSINQASGGA